MKSHRKKQLAFGSSYLLASMVAALSGVAAAQENTVSAESSDEIVVTGVQRREQAVVDVPIAMTSVSAETIENAGLTSMTDLSVLSPGLVVSRSTGFVRPVIRGVGSQVTSLGSDANVSVYLDGVYRPNQQSNQFALADIERVEVLKGPQGTLFGRNATGGAIVITTRRPSLDEAEGNISLSYGSFNERDLRGYFTTPITDTVGVSVSFANKEDDGYVYDVAQGEWLADHHETLGRVRVLYEPNERFNLIGSIYGLTMDDTTGSAYDIIGGNTSNPAAPHYPDPYEIAQSLIPYFELESWGADLQWEYDFGGFTLRSVTSYADAEVDFRSDLDGTTANASATTFKTTQRTLSQELNLSSDGPGRLQWVAGAFVYRDEGEEPFLLSTTGAFVLEATIDTDAWAVFGEVEYEVLDNLFVLAGVRYSEETRDFWQSRAGGVINQDETSWNATTPRLSVRYALNDHSNIYATYSEGFKSGTYNVTANSSTPINPENIEAFEIGYKYARAGTAFSLSAFTYNYEDLQVQAIDPGSGLLTTTNAGVVESYGLDAELTMPIGERWDLRAGASYLHAEYESFPNAQGFLPLPSGNGNSSVAPYDATGNTVEFSPEYTAHVSLTYTMPVGEGEIASTLTAFYTSEFFYEVTNRLASEDQTLLNGLISWRPNQNGLQLSLWGNNLTDEAQIQWMATSALGDRVAYGRPRTVGVRIGYEF